MKDLISGYARLCFSGFGLGVDAARALGVAIFIFTIIFVAAGALIWWIVKLLLKRNKEKKATETTGEQQTTAQKE